MQKVRSAAVSLAQKAEAMQKAGQSRAAPKGTGIVGPLVITMQYCGHIFRTGLQYHVSQTSSNILYLKLTLIIIQACVRCETDLGSHVDNVVASGFVPLLYAFLAASRKESIWKDSRKSHALPEPTIKAGSVGTSSLEVGCCPATALRLNVEASTTS